MDPKFIATTINKFIHLSAAGLVVGSLIYLKFILLPTLDGRPEAERTALWQAAYKKTLRWISLAFGLLIITGMDNIMRARKTLGGLTRSMESTYWQVFWAKIAFVVVAFILVHLLMIGAPPFRKIQAGYRSWIGVLMVIALIVIYLSGYLTLTRLSILTVR